MLKKKLKHYLKLYENGERNKVLFQEFIPHDYEWRAVKIGESYFVYKKHCIKAKPVDLNIKIFVNPPKAILDFVKEVCEKRNFNFMPLDIFEPKLGKFLVNELQTIFGKGLIHYTLRLEK